MLTRQKGIGPWTAEMILLFGLKRDDVLSFGDFGIRKGLILLYGLDDLSREQFEQYRRRFPPMAASLPSVSGNWPMEQCASDSYLPNWTRSQ